MGQFCYNVMGQGLTGAPHTYSRLKDLAMGCIPDPDSEETIQGESTNAEGKVAYEYFMDDDYGVATGFAAMLWFLHYKYFPRLSWARLTLKPTKTLFFTTTIGLLGYQLNGEGLRPSIDKIGKIRDYPIPASEKELDQFLYMTLYLKRYIPGRADHARVMKSAVLWEKVEDGDEGTMGKIKGKKQKEKKKVGWNWTERCQESFDHVKQCIINQASTGGDPSLQYHLSCDASGTGLGAILFQLPKELPGTTFTGKYHGKGYQEMQIVMFISQQFSPTEQRYLNTEREALAVLRSLEEVR